MYLVKYYMRFRYLVANKDLGCISVEYLTALIASHEQQLPALRQELLWRKKHD